MSQPGPRINLPRFPVREPLKSDSKLPLIGRYCILGSSFLTFLVAMIHLCMLDVSLKFPPSGVNFVEDTNKYTFRLSLFSFTPQTLSQFLLNFYILVDAWTPFAFFLIGSIGHTEQFQCNFALKNFLHYSVFHLLMVLFGNFPYAGGIGIVFGIINFIIWPFFVFLAIMAPAEDASFHVYLGFKDLAPSDEVPNPNSVAAKTVGGSNPLVNNRTGDFPVVNRQQPDNFPTVFPIQTSNAPGSYHNNPLAQYGTSGLHISASSKVPAPVAHTTSNIGYYNSNDNGANLEASGAQRVPSNSMYANGAGGQFNSIHGNNHMQQGSSQQIVQGGDHMSHHSSHHHRVQQNAPQQNVPPKPTSNNTVYGMAMTGF